MDKLKILRGFSIIETLVALSLISLIFTLAISFFLKTTGSFSKRQELFFMVDQRVSLLKSSNAPLTDTTILWNGYEISQTCESNEENKQLMFVKITAKKLNNNKIINERKIFLLSKSEPE